MDPTAITQKCVRRYKINPKLTEANTLRVLLTGDSLMARREDAHGPLINKALRNRRPGLVVDNTAVSGDQTPDLLARVDYDVVQRPHADWVFVLIGTNDAAAHKLVPLAQFRVNLEQIVARIVAVYSADRVVLITPPPVNERLQRHRSNARIQQYGQVLSKVAAAYDARVLDLYHLFMVTPNLEATVDGGLHDGLHFGKFGYGILLMRCSG
ncbi:GDSL-type esterase/lipase family protein [Lacticaseibacillus thailandensis]|uniref:GDSL-type esterase/lipase family protein n=1 Tax=Lacticaseibacillus thailandensis TaxID=381741 RepID=UPI0021E79155|nr:GDSL-type esterase/lipase family protein [Lacticaseibacillus thailandensis]